jgi:hypothetical protein
MIIRRQIAHGCLIVFAAAGKDDGLAAQIPNEESLASKVQSREALPQKSDLSFTPGFSPVIMGHKDRRTVSTVSSFASHRSV